jgi:hypothetical protein
MVNRSQNISVYAPVDQIRGIGIHHYESTEFSIQIMMPDDDYMLIPAGSEGMAKELVNELPLYISGSLLDGAPCVYIDIDKFVEARKHKLLDREPLKCSCGSELKVDLRVNSNVIPEKFILDCKGCESKYRIPAENQLAWCKSDDSPPWGAGDE